MTITPNVNRYRTTQRPVARPAPLGLGWAIVAVIMLAVFVAALCVGYSMALGV